MSSSNAKNRKPPLSVKEFKDNRSSIFRLDGRIAMVTGAARGLGYTMAHYLAEFGADVAIADIDMETAEKAAEELRTFGTNILPFRLDVADVAQINQVVDSVVEQMGGIDILVNNAGINIRELALDVTEEHWDKILDINLKGLFFTAQAAARYMSKQKYGKIVNMASHMAKIALPLRAAYCASKGGVAQLTKELAMEWAEYNITVNTIAPSFFVTPMNEPLFADEKMANFIRQNTPIGRPGDPEELGGALIFLASQASTFITGHMLLVDGGFTSR